MMERRAPPHHASSTPTPTPTLLPAVRPFFAVKTEPRSALPSLPSLLGSLSSQSHHHHVQSHLHHPHFQHHPQQQQFAYDGHYLVDPQQQQQQQQQYDYDHEQLLLPQQVSISSLLNPTTHEARRAHVSQLPVPSTASTAAAAALVRMRPASALEFEPKAATTANASASYSPTSHRSSESADTLADAPSQPPKKKRKARICKTDGCEKYVVDRGLCIRHGVRLASLCHCSMCFVDQLALPSIDSLTHLSLSLHWSNCAGRQALLGRRLQLPRAEPRAVLEARRLHALHGRRLHEARQVTRHLLVAWRRHALQARELREDRSLARSLLGPRRWQALPRGRVSEARVRAQWEPLRRALRQRPRERARAVRVAIDRNLQEMQMRETHIYTGDGRR